ncbi:MAG: hypothetical protein ISP56_06630 [Flavobacteriaceae bacterium]|nr:hypothetical protein [Flavobacteriaceae bacterium]
MKIIYVFFCVFFVGCSNVKKDLKTSNFFDYNELNIFISDSLPILVDFDEKHSDVINQWNEISLIYNVKNINVSDSREVNYILSTLKSDIIKISDKIVPFQLNHPQIIGRFRVLKTDILKLNSENMFNNTNKFKDQLKDIFFSYNAFVNAVNYELSNVDNEKLLLN